MTTPTIGTCDRLHAQINTAQCAYNRRMSRSSCAGCPGLSVGASPAVLATAPPAPAVPAGAVVLQFVGTDAEIVRRISTLSTRDGHDPASDVATILDLFLDGQLRVVRS